MISSKTSSRRLVVYSKLKFRKWFKYGLKAQKLTAQGIALGSFVCRTVALKGQKLSISEPYTKKGLPLTESPFLRL